MKRTSIGTSALDSARQISICAHGRPQKGLRISVGNQTDLPRRGWARIRSAMEHVERRSSSYAAKRSR
jgi:hypothetical protein